MPDVLANPDTWPWLGLVIGFDGTCLIIALGLAAINLSAWHEIFHARRGVLRIGSCNRCAKEWLR